MNRIIFVIAIFMLMFSFVFRASASLEPRYQVDIKGDVNNDKIINLSDAVLTFQFLAAKSANQIRSDYTGSGVDIDNNNHLGLPEAVYILQVVAGLKAKEELFDHIYDVGPGYPYTDPSQVPWESIKASTLVRIYFRDTPYAVKWVISTTGTFKAPVVVRGIPNQSGELPVITGKNAITRRELDYWNEERSVVKIGGSSKPNQPPEYISIENLDIKSAHPDYKFTNDSGKIETYSKTTASVIHIENGAHITIKNCILHDGVDGFFAGSGASDVLLQGNHIYGNGIIDNIYSHNNYTECLGIVFQYNYFGPLRDGALGNNLKDRSAGTVIRYNWIESGNRTIDLVDSNHSELLNDPSYKKTMVYGNVLIKKDVIENGQVLHYGGDSGDYNRYRKGTLWFYNNTVISYRSKNTTLLGISTNDEKVECFNNLIYTTESGIHLAIMDAKGTVSLHNNWLPTGWKSVYGTLLGILNASQNLEGDVPGFNDFANQIFFLNASSVCVNAGALLPSELVPEFAVNYQYVKHTDFKTLPDNGTLNIGAFGQN